MTMTFNPSQRSSFLKQGLYKIPIFYYLMIVTPQATLAFVSPTVTCNGHAQLKSTTIPFMVKKSSDRAHIERNLEDMMGNDWREFRAKLVAQEQAAASLRQQVTQQLTMKTTSRSPSGGSSVMSTDPELYYHAHDVIHHTNRPFPMQQQPSSLSSSSSSSSSSFMTDMPPSHCVGNLFAGAINIFDGYRISGKSLQCSDPFVSEDELPIVMQKQVTINKHRWAHVIPYPEPGSVLISNTMFHQTVVLVISHCDVKGSTGIVINRYVPLTKVWK
jgi:putative transcriptional regulator